MGEQLDIQHSNSKDVRFRLWLILMALAIFGAALAALCMGQFSIPVRTVFEQLLGRGEDTGNIRTVLFRIRIPRIIMASVSGAGLACAGAAFQSLFGNPLATPDTLGVANAASFGAALGILLGQNAAAVQGLALVFGLAAVFLVFLLTGRRGMPRSILAIVLSGLVVSSLFSALVSLIKYVADPQDVLPVITFWLMGSFSGVTKAGVK